MADPRGAIERELERIAPPPFTLEAFHERRARSVRNRRIAGGIAGIAVAVAGLLIGLRLFASTIAPVPASQTPAPVVSSSADEPAWDLAARAVMLRDPAGDPYPDPAGFLDSRAYGVVRGTMDGIATFAFPFAVNEPIPTSFQVPLGYDAAQYSYCLDTDKTKSPGGYPFATVEPVSCEFILVAQSTGDATWKATLIDRQPLLVGRDAKVVDVPFFIDDTRKEGVFTVPASRLGDPSTFEWSMTVSLVHLPSPSDDYINLDANINTKSFER